MKSPKILIFVIATLALIAAMLFNIKPGKFDPPPLNVKGPSSLPLNVPSNSAVRGLDFNDPHYYYCGFGSPDAEKYYFRVFPRTEQQSLLVITLRNTRTVVKSISIPAAARRVSGIELIRGNIFYFLDQGKIPTNQTLPEPIDAMFYVQELTNQQQ